MHANDPIVDEIHRIRAEIMNEQDNDIDKLFAYFQRRQEASGQNYVTLSPRPARYKKAGSQAINEV